MVWTSPLPWNPSAGHAVTSGPFLVFGTETTAQFVDAYLVWAASVDFGPETLFTQRYTYDVASNTWTEVGLPTMVAEIAGFGLQSVEYGRSGDWIFELVAAGGGT